MLNAALGAWDMEKTELTVFIRLLEALCHEWARHTPSDIRLDEGKIELLNSALLTAKKYSLGDISSREALNVPSDVRDFYESVYLRDVWSFTGEQDQSRTDSGGSQSAA